MYSIDSAIRNCWMSWQILRCVLVKKTEICYKIIWTHWQEEKKVVKKSIDWKFADLSSVPDPGIFASLPLLLLSLNLFLTINLLFEIQLKKHQSHQIV